MKTETVENMCGGKGEVIISHIRGEKELKNKCGLYAQVTINPGSSLGYHEHHGESETYYILSGEGVYDDNGKERKVKSGDMTFTPTDAARAAPTGDSPLYYGTIIKD